jgi:hypothetical protein
MGEIIFSKITLSSKENSIPIGTLENPANSGIQLRDEGYPTGNYFFNTSSGVKEAYTDMENDGGG